MMAPGISSSYYYYYYSSQTVTIRVSSHTFYRPDALHVTRPAVSQHWRLSAMHSMSTVTEPTFTKFGRHDDFEEHCLQLTLMSKVQRSHGSDCQPMSTDHHWYSLYAATISSPDSHKCI